MDKPLQGRVSLPGSKSESQRALMIAAYGGFSTAHGNRSTTQGPSFVPITIENLSRAHDTVLLQSLLEKIFAAEEAAPVTVDCEDAGTATRFLLPMLASREGTWLVTGTERLRQRPMAPLVKALRALGADLVCLEKEGFLPLRVQGRPLRGGAVTLDASQSSQFASALLLAAPMWPEGLTLHLEGPVASKPYLDMTLAMMRQAGAEVAYPDADDACYIVSPKPYQPCRFVIDADWSAASYWYEFAALNAPCSLLLEGLRPASLQGDSIVARWYEHFGVQTTFEAQGARITCAVAPTPASSPSLAFSFEHQPDLFPAVLVTCVALHLPAVFIGIRNLSYKESDRVKALITELSKVYTFINIIEDDRIIIESSSISSSIHNDNRVLFYTYQDHRMAMALAPLKKRFPQVLFRHPEVVDKSYPGYWSEFEALAK